VPACREALVDAPAIIDYLCSACREDFDLVQQELGKLKVPYKVDKRLVRGLDYYTRTTFEILTGSLGAQSAVTGGGRYDNLVKELGGPDIPATGFAIGFDRLAELVGLAAEDYHKKPQVFLAALGGAGRRQAFEWNCQLGKAGVRAELEFADKGLKAQMKRANRLDAAYVVIVGDEELQKGAVILRDMQTKAQREIPLDRLVQSLMSLFGE
jgi:histidyl-tRNA synthetase